MAQTEFSQVYNENKTKLFRIQTEWETQSLTLFILDKSAAWFARVTEDHINNLAEQHELKPNEYFHNLKSYICDEQIKSISFDVKDKQFIVYRSFSTEKLRQKFFFIQLEKITYQTTAETVIDNLATKFKETLKNLKKIEEEKIEALTQKLLLEKQCEEFVELKRKSDIQMYSAFALALNEKKHRIRFLTELLECPQKQKQMTSIEENDGLSDSDEINTKLEVLSDSESNKTDNYHTDDEKEGEIQKLEPLPSTSKTNYDFLGGDSPPPLLPKRVKIDRTNTQNPVKKINDKDSKKMEIEIINNEEPEEEINFSTQDLLDRM